MLTEKGSHDNELIETLMKQQDNLQKLLERQSTNKENTRRELVVRICRFLRTIFLKSLSIFIQDKNCITDRCCTASVSAVSWLTNTRAVSWRDLCAHNKAWI